MTNYENFIEDSVEKFRKILSEQLAREDRMASEQSSSLDKKEKITIGIIGGDGIGPLIVGEAERVLKKLLKDEIACGSIVLKNIEGLTIENRMEKGRSVPEDVLSEIKSCDVLLKGPTTTPKGGTMESANVTLRRELDLYANVRPVVVPEKNINWIFFRENTEGEYALGSRGIELPGKLAMDFKVTTESGTRRIAKSAYEYAKNNNMGRVSIVTKANIMKKTDGKFSALCHEVASQYPEIETDEWYIDIMAANLINEKLQSSFKVFLLPNLYGDIITDEAAQIQGGVGTAGSSNMGDKYAMFEAIHGSAPRMVEEGIAHKADPRSILTAAEMMLRHIGLISKADRLSSAIAKAGEDKRVVPTGTKDGPDCSAFTDKLLEIL